jgi:hypothetical protein
MGAFREKSAWGGGEWRTWVFVTFWCVVIMLVVVVAVFAIRNVGHTIDTTKCAAQAQYFPDRNVEFVDWNYFDWDCLVETDSGVFVPVGDYRATVEGD